MKKFHLNAVLAVTLGLASLAAQAAPELTEVRVAYSNIVPETLVAKDKGWIEEALKPQGISVKWVESLGSNKTIEFLRGKSLDIGTSSLASAFLARANGTPIKYVYWTGRNGTGSPILVRKDATYRSIADLKGKKIAATPGTGPYISLIAALDKFGLSEKDVNIVSLQHSQGRLALAAGQVEAWAGLDPDWAIAEVQNGARVLFADPDLAGGGGVDVREDFLLAYPDVVKAVLAGFDRARVYSRQNQDASIKIFAEKSKVELAVAQRVFARNNTEHPELLPEDTKSLITWGEIYRKIGSIPANTDVAAVVKATLDASVFKPAR
ncbi:MAG: aliphatic sulfonates family transporter periplasmic ligand-binding protein [Proteobacteria bacterium]|nr:aliphatic sulfonates family transporter periplasmic ligand-binding protein [Pseudomonadota bacterium]